MRAAQPAAEEPALRRAAGPFGCDIWHRHERNDRCFGRPAEPDNRADRRVVGGPEHTAELAAIMSGECGVYGRAVGVVDAVVSRANEGAAVNLRANAGRCSLNWTPGILEAIGLNSPRISAGADRLHVPHVEVAGPTVQKDQDARVGRGRKRGLAGGRSGGQTVPRAHPAAVVGAEQAGKAQAEEEASAQLQHLAPSDWLRAAAGEWPGDRQAMPQFEKGLVEHACSRMRSVKQFSKNSVIWRRGLLESEVGPSVLAGCWRKRLSLERRSVVTRSAKSPVGHDHDFGSRSAA